MIAQVATPTIRVPASLAELDQWIVWRYEQRDGGKPTKVPYQINGSHASSTDTKTWCSWDEALKTWQQDPRRWSGIGFVFSPGDPYFGIDLDDCIDAAGKLKPWAQPIMERFSESYAEISPSGRGIKIWGNGRLPGGGTAFPLGDGGVEIYDQARYFTVTGNHWAGEMLDVEEHQAALDWLLALSPHGQKKVPFTLDEGKIPKGHQHDTLVSIAGTMRARGCELPEIEAALLEINRSRLEEPAAEENIKRIAGSVCRYAPGDKRGIGGADRALRDRADEISIPATVKWPAPIDEAAYYGLAGDIVRTLEPQTEADPVALLIHVLVGVGNLGGRSPHFRVGGASHHTNENAICVGKTSSARKGTAKSDTFNLLCPVDPTWVENHVMAGLSSGEGLIWAVRDEIEKQEPIRDKQKTITGYQTVIADKGVADKRLLVIEPEFASVLRVAGRDGNTLSTVYRQAWDSGLLRVLNKNSPVKATGAHISIIGHITRDELLMELSNNDKVNGFGNRNLWLCVQRSKFLPDGGDWDNLDIGPLISRLKNVIEFARGVGEMRRNAEARAMWHEVYPQLSGERAGLFGSLTSRAEAHVLRLSCIYALLDHSTEVRRCHLEAALALWKYCEDSAEFIFGDALGNQVADQILKALGNAPEGLTRNDIHNLFVRHRTSAEIGAALRILSERGLVEVEKEDTGGRPVERWFATSEEARKARKARKEQKGEGE
jgi:hypothetical protein